MTTTTHDPNRSMWQARARGDQDPPWEELGTAPEDVEVEPDERPAGLWLRPPGAAAGPALLAVHGGGFVSGSARTHRRMFAHLARAAGLPTFVIEYGLVPEQVFPGQVDTVLAGYRRLLEQGWSRIALTGDSCGATLALSLALRTRDAHLPPPAALLLMSAWTDLEATGTSYDTASDPFFTRDLVRALAAGYLAGTDPRDPLAAPLHADLRALSATYLQVGAEESLLDDSRRLGQRLQRAGVPVQVEEFAGQLHTFQMGAGRTAVADDAIRKGGSWLRSTLGR